MKAMIEKRIRKLNRADYKKGLIVYWMSRDQRIDDNWALLHAQQLAKEKKQAFAVIFCLVPEFLKAEIRQYHFMFKGLQRIESDLKNKNIPFYLLFGQPKNEIPKFIKKYKISALISDFDPLKIKRKWKNQIKRKINIPFCEIDAHNIVPVWEVSDKQEYAAYTIRPKIKKLLPIFLTEFDSLKKQKAKWPHKIDKINWNRIDLKKIDKKVKAVDWLEPGEDEAKKTLKNFIKNKLNDYPEKRNDPTEDGQSNLSPYLHFGQISAQRVALEINRAKGISKKAKEEFLEELIIRKELSDNFVFYNKKYDRFDGFPDWAKKTLNAHRNDKREYQYSRKKLEQGKTHDDLWNTAQLEMVKRGKMHGYMRMYWAKKILEWTKSPELAQERAIYLNDKYELDGRDPNGYTGIAWSIGGAHDRAWAERKVFGKIRYMSYNGAKSKFDVEKYIEMVKQY